MMFEKPVLNGKTDRENLQKLKTWADNMVDKLNYASEQIEKKTGGGQEWQAH